MNYSEVSTLGSLHQYTRLTSPVHSAHFTSTLGSLHQYTRLTSPVYSAHFVTNSSRVYWSGIAVARSSFHAIYIFVYIYIYIFNGSCSSCLLYGMASLPTLSLAAKSPGEDPVAALPWDAGGHSCFIKILQQRHTLETPMAKLRSRWPESS